MKTATERTQIIADRRQPSGRTPYWHYVRDDYRKFDVWSVPVEALVLNLDNRRFRAEKMWAEAQLGRSLDPVNHPDDAASVEALLLDSQLKVQDGQIVGTPGNDYVALKNDWQRRDQESPLWIRPDGTVRNGNRRLAMVNRLQREIGDEGLQWVDAIILDVSSIDEQTLLEMEQHEQLTENFKVRYNDIDYLLALREMAEMRDIEWFDASSIDDVSGKLQSLVEKSQEEVLRDLYAIKYMDHFLEDSEQSGMYHILLRTLEKFRDIGRLMVRAEVEYPLEAERILQVMFAAVRAEKKYGDIRRIRRMFWNDRARFDQLAEEIEEAEGEWEPSGADQVSAPTTAAGVGNPPDDDEEESGESESGPHVADYPVDEVGARIDAAIDGFSVSEEENVLTIILEVVNRLNVISEGQQLPAALAADDQQAREIKDHIIVIMSIVDQSLRPLVDD